MPSVTCKSPVLPTQQTDVAIMTSDERGTHAQILKSSALVGGSSILNIAIGIVRTKIMAVLLGPAGFGLFAIYGSIVTLTQTIVGMGINSSGVRQIAEANSWGDADHIAQTTMVLRRISILLGLLGAFVLVTFSRQVSTLTFGNDRHSAAVSLLSLAVFFGLVSAGQGALIQGMRRIGDLARMGVLGALSGTLISIPLVYFLRDRGVVPSLVAVGATTALTSWWYSRKIRIEVSTISATTVVNESLALLKLGFAFMFSSLMTMGTAYVIRIAVLRKVGFEATGLYQSAWTLGSLYVGFILQAMGADFYPRLTAAAKNNTTCNRLVNEQAQVGLLLAAPGVIATLTFAPLVIALFYSSKFSGAVEMLRWICLGTILQVMTWPMGFIIVAKAKQVIFIICELVWTVVSLGLAWTCVSYFGLKGVGIAFFGSYIFHGLLIYAVVYRLSGFRWSTTNKRGAAFLLLLVAVTFCGFYMFSFRKSVGLGVFATILSGIYSLRMLGNFISKEYIPGPAGRILAFLDVANLRLRTVTKLRILKK
jgi:enterobacterial common antigen flippase